MKVLSAAKVFVIFSLSLAFTESFGANPRAHHLYISGTTAGANPAYAGSTQMKVGNTLRVRYTWADPDVGNFESGTTYQWYRYTNNTGVGKVAIPGATLVSYALVAADLGLHISVEVRPRDNTGAFGAIVEFRPWNAGNSNIVYPNISDCSTPSGVGVPTPGNNILNVPTVCSPSTVQWEVVYTGINYRIAFPPRIRITWGDLVAPNPEIITPDLVNPLITLLDTFNLVNPARQRWRVAPTHTFDYALGSAAATTPGERCTYILSATWETSSVCPNAQTQPHTVWDNESNTNLGQVDMSWDASSATGVEAGEVTSVCQGDGQKVVLADRSDFNCTPLGAAIQTNNKNDQARWVQFVYGTASTVTAPGGVGGSIIINNISYNSTQLPIYGPVQYLPASIEVPTSLSQSIQMPSVTGVAGQNFIVTMRTWNTCAAFDNFIADANGLNPPQGAPNNVFNIYGPPGTITASLGGPPFFANSAPALRTYTIAIITKPTTPVANNKEFCAGTVLDPPAAACGAITANNQVISFELTAASVAGSTAINWFFGDPRSGGVALNGNANVYSGGTNCRFFRPRGLLTTGAQGTMRTALLAGTTGVYSIWATYSIANGCVSDPVEVFLTIRPSLTIPSAPTGTSPVCNGSTNVAYTQGAASASVSIPATTITNPAIITYPTRFVWSTPTAGVTVTSPGTSVTANFTIAPEPSPQSTALIRTAREFTSSALTNTGAATFCTTTNSPNLSVLVDGVSSGGTITPTTQTQCEGLAITSISLGSVPTVLRGTIQGWERKVNAGAFVADGSLGTSNPITPAVPIVGGVQTTYQYRAIIQNGSCGPVFSPISTIIVNPRPTSATIAGNATICRGSSTNLTVTIVGGTSPYTVTYNDGSGNTVLPGYVSGTNIPVSPLITRTYTLVSVTDAAGPPACTPVSLLGSAVVTVSNPTSATISGAANICPLGTTNLVVTIAGGISATPYTVNYTANGVAQAPIPGYLSGNNIPVSPAITTTYILTSVTDANGCPALTLLPPGGVTVTVGSVPSAATFGGGGAVCLNGTRNLTLTITGGVAPYTVTIPGINMAALFPLGYTSGAAIPAPTSVVGTINYNATFIVDFCGATLPGATSGNPQAVTVNNIPTASNSSPPAVCSQTTLNIDPTANITNGVPSSFTWTAAYPGGLTGGAASGSGNINVGPLANLTGGALSAVFTVTPSSTVAPTLCTGATFTITQSVNPQPVATPKTTAAVCSNVAFSFNPQTVGINGAGGNSVASNFTWVRGALPGGLTQVVGGTGVGNIAETLQNLTNAQLSAVYTVTPRAVTGNCLGNTFTITVPVNPQPVATAKTTAAVCSNVAFSFNPQTISINGAGGNSVPSTFTWTRGALGGLTVVAAGTGTGNIAETLQNITGAAITVTYTVTPTAVTGGCVGNPFTIDVPINAEPVISVQPTPVISCLGDVVTYTITASGPGLTFQWQENGVNLTNVGVYSGVTTSTLTLTGVTLPMSTRQYRVVLTTTGSCTKTSNQALLTVNPLPTVNNLTPALCSDIPAGTTRVTNLQTFNTSISAVVGTTFSWFQNYTVATKTFSSPIGASETAYNVTNAEQLFVRVVAPVTGCINVATVNFTVNPTPVANPITGPTNVCQDATSIVVYQVTPNAGATYTWTIPTGPGQFVVAAGGGPGDFFALLQFPNIVNPGQNITVVETIAGCPGAISTRNITVDGSPPPINIVGPAAVCSNDAGVVYSVALLANTTYAWTVPIGASIIGGQGTETITVNFGSISGNVAVTPSTTSGCAGTPDSQPVVVNLRPDLSNTLDRSVCSKAIAGITLAAEVFSPVPASTYNITSVTFSVPGLTPIVGPTSGNGLLGNAIFNDQYENKTGGAIQVRYTVVPVSIDGCLGLPAEIVTLTVNPEPILSASLDKTVCSRTASAVTLAVATGSFPASTYEITSINNNGLVSSGGAPATGTLFNAGEIANDAWINTTAFPVDVEYTVRPVSIAPLSCPGDPVVIKLTITPEPTGVAIPKVARCSDNDVLGVAYTLSTSTVAATSFTIVTNSNGLSQSAGTVSAGAGKLANELIDDAWTNTGLLPVDVDYQITPFNGTCAGTSFTVIVTINPEPVGTPIVQVSRCSDIALGATYTLSSNAGSVAASTYNITISNPGALIFNGATPAAATGNAAGILTDDSWTNTGLLPAIITYNVTPVSAIGCLGNTYAVSVSIDPEPVGTPIATVSRCSDVALGAAYTLTGNVASVAPASFNITITNPGALAFSGLTPVAPTNNAGTILTDDSWTNTSLVAQLITYNITPVSAGGCLGDPYTVSVSVDPEPVGTPIATVSRCSDVVLGAAYTLSSSGASVAASTYNISVNSGGLVFSGATPAAATGNAPGILTDDSWTNTGLFAVVVTYTVTPVSAAGCLGNPYAVAVSIDPEPVGNPIVQVSRCSDTALGAAYTLSGGAGSVAASTFNISVNAGGLLFSGATPVAPTGNAAAILTDDSWTNTGLLPVVVTYTVTPVSAGGCLGDPYVVTVSIDPEPVGTPIVQVSRCSDVAIGAAYNLSSSGASVAATTYNITVNAGGLIFSGATPVAATGNAPGILIDDSWTNTGLLPVVVVYTVTPVSAAGCLGNPYAVSVSIDPEPVGAPIVQVSRCSDTTLGATYTLSNTVGSVAAATYNITVASGGLIFSGATAIAPTGNLANILIDDSWTNTGLLPVVVTYTVTPVSATGCLGNPYLVSVSIDPEPVGTPIIQVSRCSDLALGAAYTLSSSGASVAAATYNITVNSGGLVFSGATPIAPTGNPANILVDDSWTNNGLLPVVVTYTVTPVSAAGCLGDPYLVSVSVDPGPIGTPIVQVSRCSDTTLGATYTLSNTAGSVAAATYNITVASGGLVFSGATPIAATGNPANILVDDSWTNTGLLPVVVTYTVTPVSAGGCLGLPYLVSVSIDPEPVGIAVVQVSRCSDIVLGAAYTLSSSAASVAAATYNITVNSGGLVFSGGTPIAATGNLSTILIDDSWTNTGLLPVVVTYTVTPVSAGGCLGNPYLVSVTVDPEPVGTPIIQVSRCSDIALGAAYALSNLGTSVAATSYNITVNAGGLVFSGATPIAATGNAANILIDDSWTNTGLLPVVVTYTVTPVSAGGCLGDPYFVSVSVDPEPVGTPIVQVSRCSDLVLGAAYTLSSSGASVAAATYNITVNSGGLVFSGATPIAATGNADNILIDDSWTNTGLLPVVVTYTVTPVSAGGCLGNPYLVSVSVDPEPVGTPIAQVSRCSDIALGAAYTLSSSGASVSASTYNITVNAGGLVFSGATPAAATGNGAGILTDDSWTNTGLIPVVVSYTITPVSAGGCLGNPYVVNVSIDPEPVGTPIVQVSRCSDVVLGGAYTLNSSGASVAAATYNITVNAGGLIFSGATPVAPTNNLPNILIDDSWTNTGLLAVIVAYTVTPVSAGGCLGDPYIVSVSVDPEPVGDPIPQVSRCSDLVLGAAYTLSSSVLSEPASTYNITVNAGGLIFSGGTPIAATGNPANILVDDSWANTGLIPVVVTYTVTPVSASGCLGNPYAVSVSIDPEPVGNAIVQVSRCSDVALGGAYTLGGNPASVAAATFNITVNSGGLIFSGGTPIAPTGNPANILIDDRWTNTGLAPVVVDYTVTPVSAGGCLGNPYSVSVSIDPEPVGNPIVQVSRCSDVVLGVAYTLSGNPASEPATTFNISVNSGGLVFSGLTPITPTGNLGNILEDDSWTNTSALPVVVTYTVTPVSVGGCLGNPYLVSVSIDPEPVGTPIVQVSRCSDIVLGAAYTLSSTGGSVTASTYNITVNPNGLIFSGATPIAATGNPAGILVDDSWTNTGLFPVVVTYTVTPVSAGGCLGNPYAVSVSIDPEPVGSDLPATRCSDEAFGAFLFLTTSGASVPASTYNISVNANGLIFSGATPAAATGNVAGILTDDKWTNTTALPVDVIYTINPVSGTGCIGSPFQITVTINPEPIGSPALPLEVCSRDVLNFDLQTIIDDTYPGGNSIAGNAVAGNFRYSVTSSPPAAGVSPGPNRLVPSAAFITDTYVNTSNVDATITYTVTPSSGAGGCEGTPFDFKVVVHPEPVGVDLTVPNCNTMLNHNIQTQITNGLPSVFTYTISQLPAAALVLPADRVIASNANITDSYTNATGSPVVVTYDITAFNQAFPTCSAGTNFKYVITISPNPIGITDTKAARCSDESFTIDPQLNISPAVASTFTWTATYDGFPIAPGSGVIITSFNNVSALPKDAVYTITPTAVGSGCVGLPFVITIPINPEPVMEPTLANPPAICSTNTVSTSITGVILNTNGISIDADSYVITALVDAGLIGVPTTGIFAAVAGTSNAIQNDTYRNTTAAQLKVVYTVVPKIGTCSGNPFDITIKVNPEPVLSTPVWPAVCSNNVSSTNIVNITLGTNGTSVNALSYELISVQYIPVVAGFTPDGTNAIFLPPPVVGGINLIKNDKYNNLSAVPVTVRYTIQGKSAAGCLSETLDYDVVINPEPTMSPGTATTCSGIALSTLTLGPAGGSSPISSYDLVQVLITSPSVVPAGTNQALGAITATSLQTDAFTNTSAIDQHVFYKIIPISGTCRGVEQMVDVTIQPAPAMFASLNAKTCNETSSGIVLLDNSITNPIAILPFSESAASFDITSIVLSGVTAFGGTNTTPRSTANPNEISGDRFTNNTNNPGTVTYKVVPISAGGCRGPEKTIFLTVEPRILADDSPDDNVCSSVGGVPNTNIILTSPSNPSTGLVTFNYGAVSSQIAGIDQVGNFTKVRGNLTENTVIQDELINTSNLPGTVTYTITPIANSAGSAGCNSIPAVNSVTVVITVEPRPKVIATSSPLPVCEGSPTSVQLTTPTTPTAGAVQFNVAATPAGGMTLTSVLKTNYLPGEFIADVWNNPTGDPQIVTYTVTPSISGGLGCTGTPITVSVTINPRPQLQPATQVDICSGTSINIPLIQVAPVVPTGIVTWTVTAPGIGGAVNGAGDEIAQTLFNNGNAPVLVTYTATPKASGCNGTPILVSFTVNPSPILNSLPSQKIICNGESANVTLASNVAGATFAWTVTDLNTPALFAPGALDGSGPVINQPIANNTGSQAAFLYEVVATGPGLPACSGISKFMTVNVKSIIPDILPDRTEICSGDRVQFFNQSLGAVAHRWHYKIQGSPTELDVRLNAVVNYQFTNTTTLNPLPIEVYYEGKNGLCSASIPTPVIINVYRGVTAGFDEGTVPPLIGTSTVTFTNTSVPVDGGMFNYDWDFGQDANPTTISSATPAPVVYSSEGLKDVTLVASNKDALSVAGLDCSSTFTKTINIPVLPLIADYDAEPVQACFPADIKITKNRSTGTNDSWTLIDGKGKVVFKSAEYEPTFQISNPGKYVLKYTTSQPTTSQTQDAPPREFEIYGNPVASFDARPDVVFVPDTELITFNYSKSATDYEWDFGDNGKSTEEAPTYVYKIEGNYEITLIAKYDHGNGVVCSDTLKRQVIAKQGGVTKVPNAFTPNPNGPSGGSVGGPGNGSFNDVFLPIVRGAEEFNMQVFDRWGNLIFESNSSTVGWDGYNQDGKLMPAGVYVYRLTLRLSDGQRSTQLGDITMIR